jgi:hypothetical protein
MENNKKGIHGFELRKNRKNQQTRVEILFELLGHHSD